MSDCANKVSQSVSQWRERERCKAEVNR